MNILFWLWLGPAIFALSLYLLDVADEFAYGTKPRPGDVFWAVASALMPVLNLILAWLFLMEVKRFFRRA